MGLMKCEECGEEVSEHAKQCPHCGIEGDPDGSFGDRHTLGESTYWGRIKRREDREARIKMDDERRKEKEKEYEEKQAKRSWWDRLEEEFSGLGSDYDYPDSPYDHR